MAEKQVVTINMMHTCPMCTGLTPHVGGPITGPGCPGILINGTPISIQGDICVCQGPPDTIVEGCPGILANGTPIVLQNCMTAHGGTIPMGVSGVCVSSNTSSVLEITKDREPAIYNLQWMKQDAVIRESKILKKVLLNAHTRNIPDGEVVSIQVNRKGYSETEGKTITELVTLEGTVQNNSIQIEWEIEEDKSQNDSL